MGEQKRTWLPLGLSLAALLGLGLVVCWCVGGITIDHTKTLSLSPKEAANYQQYAIIAANTPRSHGGSPDAITPADILPLCTLTDTRQIGATTHKLYTSDLLPQYLFHCEKIVEISDIDGFLYITYETQDGESVYLTYWDTGLVHQIVYDSHRDIAYTLSADEQTKTLNFRKGITEYRFR